MSTVLLLRYVWCVGIHKIFSSNGYEVEATKASYSSEDIELVIRRDGTWLQRIALPRGYTLEDYAAGILLGATLRNPEPASINTTGATPGEAS